MKNIRKRQESHRLKNVDAMRGFALVGVCLLYYVGHFHFDSYPQTGKWWLMSDYKPYLQLFVPFFQLIDTIVESSVQFLFSGKSYAIFALLFGYSFYVQHNNAQKEKEHFRGRFAWRMFLLFIIGTFSAVFITGDFLVMFSLTGLLLLLICKWKSHNLLILAGILLIQPFELLRLVLSHSSHWSELFSNQALSIQAGRSLFQTIKMNLTIGQLSSLAYAFESGLFTQTLACFILGVVAGRKEFFCNNLIAFAMQQRIAFVSILLYFPLNGLASILPDAIDSNSVRELIVILLNILSTTTLSIFMVCSFLIVYRKSSFKKSFVRLAAFGRMSLTNYLIIVVVGSFLFYGWGLGLHAKLGITASFLLGVFVLLIQIWLSKKWMKKHRRGPVEKLWYYATWNINKTKKQIELK